MKRNGENGDVNRLMYRCQAQTEMSRVVVHRLSDFSDWATDLGKASICGLVNRKPGLRLAQNSDYEAASCAKTRIIVDPNAGPHHTGKEEVDLHFELLGW